MSLPSLTPIAPVRIVAPFDHPGLALGTEARWLSGRVLRGPERRQVALQDRPTVHPLWALCAALRDELNGREVILDGEVVCVGADGRPGSTR